MKTLLLIRHAKASPAEPGRPDHDRALDDRGRQDAPEMGRRLKLRGVMPGLIVSSTALRTRTTARLIAEALDFPLERLVEDERVYASSVMRLLYLVQALDNKLACVIVVGHNPEMTELARKFSDEIPDLPTCAVAEFGFHTEAWSDIGRLAPAVSRFDSPKKRQDSSPP